MTVAFISELMGLPVACIAHSVAQIDTLDSLVTKACPRPVAETVEMFTALVVEHGLKVFTVVDHSGAAHELGLELRETKVVFFGSPIAGTPVMAAEPLAALDLPLKVLIWDDAGQTKLSYLRPSAFGERYQLPVALAQRLNAIDDFTELVSQRHPE